MNFEQVEDAIISRSKDQLAYVRTCETWAGQLEGEIDKLTINYPAVFVSYGGSKLEWIDNINFNEAVEFDILVAAKNLRGQEAARKDEQGCYQMIMDILTALTNQTLDLDIERLRPVSVDMIGVTKTVAIYGIKFQTNFDNTYEVAA